MKRKIIVSLEYIKKSGVTTEVIRTIELNGKQIYSERCSREAYITDTSILRQFELWLIGEEFQTIQSIIEKIKEDKLRSYVKNTIIKVFGTPL